MNVEDSGGLEYSRTMHYKAGLPTEFVKGNERRGWCSKQEIEIYLVSAILSSPAT
jgi:hypothetical protein